MQSQWLLLTFAFSGVTLKLADHFGEDRGGFPAYFFAAFSAFFFGLLVSESPYSSAIIIGIMIGVIFSGKVNRLNLVFGTVMTIIISALIGFINPLPWLLIVVTISSYIDEIGHERIGKKNIFFTSYFRYRFTLKIAVFLLAILEMLPFIYCIGFLCFDLSYDAITLIFNKTVQFNRRSRINCREQP